VISEIWHDDFFWRSDLPAVILVVATIVFIQLLFRPRKEVSKCDLCKKLGRR